MGVLSAVKNAVTSLMGGGEENISRFYCGSNEADM